MKKILLMIITIFIIISSCIFGVFYILNNEHNLYITKEDLISRQANIDTKIKKALKNDLYRVKNPYIIKNPYEISPLTALIVFTTTHNEEIDVYVNDLYLSTMEKSKKHIIPIYYLKENYENIVKLRMDNQEYTYTIKTDKLDINSRLEVISNNIDENILLSSSTSALTYSLFNPKGEIIWHLNMDSQGHIERLKNGNFLVSAEEYVTDNNVSNGTSIYEIDYLGKIIKRFDLKYYYHHVFKEIDDNKVLIAGTSDINHQMNLVYKMDLNDGTILDTYDFYEILKSNINNFDEIVNKLPFGLGLNSIDYLNDHLIVALRNLNLIVSIDTKTKGIDYIISDKLNDSNIIKPNINLSGMHDVKYYKNDINKISLYNNNYDMNSKVLKPSSDAACGYVLSIGSKVSVIDKFKYENKNSYAFGSLDIKDNNTLVNYSYMFNDKAIKNNTSILDYQGNTYSNIIIYNNKKIVFKGKIEDRIYKATFFNIHNTDKDYEIKKYKYINNMDNVEIISKKIKGEDYNNFLSIYKNYIEVELSEDLYKDLYIIFKGDKTYKIKYLNTRTYYELPDGFYDVYVQMDDKYYDLNTMIKKKN